MGRECMLIAVQMHMRYLFPIGDQNLFSSQHCTHFTLPSRHTTSFQRLWDVYTTSPTLYRRLLDVETTSCVYWVPTEFWISIHNETKSPILDNYGNEIIPISLCFFHFLVKGAVSSSRLPICFNPLKVFDRFDRLALKGLNTIITSNLKNLYWRNEKLNLMVTE